MFSETEDPNKREYRAGNFVSVYDKPKDDHRVFVNSLGEGALLVCNANGNISNGDYIESFKEGYGAKQKATTLRNSTVAKVTQDVDFKDVVETTDIDGTTYKVSLVGCTYHCG